ncbi:MAG TPA: hypothetical protein VF538_16095 [Pyrinomonadaceae bacterium]|jgi:ABC-type Fe3+-hydroxamate transport system substrate-binding protein
MKSRIKIVFAACALVAGLAVGASAQSTYRTRNGRTVTVYQNNRRVVRRPNGRTVVVLPNGNRVVRSSRSRQYYPQVRRARSYRLPNGRIVTVLPNGRRIIR